MDCLIIKELFLQKIFFENKIWEIRGSKTNKRGKIGLIQSGSKTIVGECELIDCLGPLSKKDLINSKIKHKVNNVNSISYNKIYAWVIKNPVVYKVPKPYNHPNGAIIWVKV